MILALLFSILLQSPPAPVCAPAGGIPCVTVAYYSVTDLLPVGTAVMFEKQAWMPLCGQAGPFTGQITGYQFTYFPDGHHEILYFIRYALEPGYVEWQPPPNDRYPACRSQIGMNREAFHVE